MAAIRFVLVGGFLGAGKTTTIARLAKMYQDRGQKVGIVTNDQATDLVDTLSLRQQGFEVGEVAGACFCCNFNELTKTSDKLAADRPDVILAEPVGSCTDIVATVAQPLMKLFGDKFDVAPYGVILKPSHGRKILKNQTNSGFSPKAAYIFTKQLEEADFVVLNRVDELSPAEVAELTELLTKAHPGVPILKVSAKSGQGFEALVEMIDQRGQFGKRILELDYDIYAEGEAELGWLNSNLTVTAAAPFSLDKLVQDIVAKLQTVLNAIPAETAHLKAIGLSDESYAVVNLVSSDSQPVLSLASHAKTAAANLVVNARVAVDPESLKQIVEQEVGAVCQAHGAAAKIVQTQCFRPGRPVPTHRFAAV